jgi:molybdenum cofactor cytidylyltransferase
MLGGTLYIIAALILAAGTSSRMKTTKQLLRIDVTTMLEAVVRAASESKADEVFVVLGHQSEGMLDRLNRGRASVVLCDDHREGISVSLSAGLKTLGDFLRALVVMLGDQPLITGTIVGVLIEEYDRSGRPMVARMCEGKRRNPVLFDLSLRSEILETEEDVGAKEIIERHRKEMAYVHFRDNLLFLDVDTPEDYAGGKGMEETL